ncbi:hypothetical protein [Sphingopyxis yananensis]|uniref:hypothetical protein n=1 Tax=Sphingopyxis yananensis TaxID=2886687 RepID=UPI001D12144D|nr:hypothetical protein [Sphingopyxis yananensis]MCC2603114.1 hypothetical protein [Sphingopyxis yananensis]
MTQNITATATAPSGLSMGHLAVHYYDASDAEVAAKLLRAIGLVETQMLPLPQGNFYRYVVGENHFARGDGIIYLSALLEPQRILIDAITSKLGVGTAEEDPAVQGFRDMMSQDPEASFHFGFLMNSLEELEAIVLDLREKAETDPDFKDRINIVLNRAMKGDADVDARLDASPIYADATRFAYGRRGVQAFIETDILRSGQLGDKMVIELDYVFPDSDSHILSVVEFG